MHENYLKKALTLAAIRRGFCAPNPAVGAVVVKNGCILAEGYHSEAGQPHAEVVALNKLGEQAKDATLYVTLEPCCHFGKTPPCTNLIIERGIKDVFYGYSDPNPLVAGKGEQQLRAAGIACQAIAVDEINEFYRSYSYFRAQQRPWVTAKLALSLDGKVAGAHNKRVAITGQVANEYTQYQRKISDALLTTINTILADDPKLNCRVGDQVYKKPLFILDSHARLPLNATLFSTTQSITLFHSQNVEDKLIQNLEMAKVKCVVVPSQGDYLDLRVIIAEIGQVGIHDLWVEAGPTLFNQLINLNLVQKIILYFAPKCLGPDAKNAFVGQLDLFATAKSIRWSALGIDGMCEIE